MGTKNSLLLEKDGKLGLCDNKGKVVIKPEYKEIIAILKLYDIIHLFL